MCLHDVVLSIMLKPRERNLCNICVGEMFFMALREMLIQALILKHY